MISARLQIASLHLVAPLSFLATCTLYFFTHEVGDKLRAVELALFGPLKSPFGMFFGLAFYLTFLAATALPQAFTIGAFIVLGLPAWYFSTWLAFGLA